MTKETQLMVEDGQSYELRGTISGVLKLPGCMDANKIIDQGNFLPAAHVLETCISLIGHLSSQ